MRKDPLTKKYSPKKSSEIFGQDSALAELKKYVTNYKTEKKKAALLHGDTGTGKTSAVHALAKELNFELIELNASDCRDEESINSILGAAIKQKSFFFASKLILVDEVDGISGSKDRGGLTAVINLMQKSTFPIVLTMNDPWDNKFSSLRSKTQMIEFKPVNYLSIVKILKRICESEQIKFEEDAIVSIARRAGGDARAAINDLDIISHSQNSITKADLESLSLREKEETIHNALMRVFKTKDAQISLTAFDYVNMDYNEIMLWLDENLPKEYSGEDLKNAYYYLARADQMSGRIKKRQNWRMLSYIMNYLTVGISMSKKEKNPNFVKYTPTMRLLKIWQINMKYAKRKEIAKKVAAKTHTSAKEAAKSTVPYLKVIFKNDKTQAKSISEFLKLTDEEVAWLSA